MTDRASLVVAQPASRTDGTARGARTRRRIVDATVSLLEEGVAPPTAHEIAERAGVSLRLVFHHFADLDSLHRTVCDRVVDRFRVTICDVPADLPLATRIERTVRCRADLYEAIGNLGRNAAVLATTYPAAAEGLARMHDVSVSSLEHTFASELRAAGRGRKELVGSLAAAASWQVWDQLRDENGLSAAAARRAVGRMLRVTVAAD